MESRNDDRDHAAIERDRMSRRPRLQILFIDRRQHIPFSSIAARVDLGRRGEEAQAIAYLDLGGVIDFLIGASRDDFKQVAVWPDIRFGQFPQLRTGEGRLLDLVRGAVDLDLESLRPVGVLIAMIVVH
ncbi:hypothetical protein MPLSOD_340066 [Mesorhizobium sp. SOD10]|nr:hypothetical protein MPLSOD_340066 [Mesorhizobium sp. SOD10]